MILFLSRFVILSTMKRKRKRDKSRELYRKLFVTGRKLVIK